MAQKPTSSNNKGFTLIELLVVIAVIGLLASVTFIAVNNARISSRDTKRVADLAEFKKATELYFQDKGYYPPIPSGMSSPFPNMIADDMPEWQNFYSANFGSYMQGSVLKSPSGGNSHYIYYKVPNRQIIWLVNPKGYYCMRKDSFYIGAYLENPSDPRINVATNSWTWAGAGKTWSANYMLFGGNFDQIPSFDYSLCTN